MQPVNLPGRGLWSCVELQWPTLPVRSAGGVLRDGDVRAHGDELVHAEQAQYPGDGGLRGGQFQCAATGFEGAVSLHERLDGGGVGEPQTSEVDRQVPNAGGDLHGKRGGQFRGRADVRLAGQHQDRAAIPGGH
jgi:hypothetical protein